MIFGHYVGVKINCDLDPKCVSESFLSDFQWSIDAVKQASASVAKGVNAATGWVLDLQSI